MRLPILLVLLAAPVTASAGDTVLEPGEYEVEMRLELPYVEDMGVQKTARVCLTGGGSRGIVVLSENNPLVRCPVSNVSQEADELTFDLVCEGHNQAVARAKFRLRHDRFDGAFDMKMGGKNMTMTERQKGRRVGACKDAPHSQ
ncbi:DUF3617 domain-containing protein [Hyphomicrobium sp.]|uniref:DUF3617 domain-containing protein n=1 Tax=Hyphomicrobium sp. TaxID=82 RepID=UPI002E30B661|nr:DUF3617 family protein [Hyphomicrobium sp.]HEX2843601.1 DUF3617 family protein [Hyphomicrobium sp.]